MQDEARFRAIIADDHAIVRSGLKSALESSELMSGLQIEVVAEASDGLQAISAVKRHRPDLMLLDVSMPLAGGVEVLVEARRWSPDTKYVVFTGISAVGKVSDLIDIGVDGLFSKSTSNEEMYQHLPRILEGERFIAPFFTQILSEQIKQSSLTDRERQILNLVVSGRGNKEIADWLGISDKTVDRHRTSLMQKLDVHSLAQLISYALQHGLIDAAPEL